VLIVYVRETYTEYLLKQLSNEEALDKTMEVFEELIGDEEEPLLLIHMLKNTGNKQLNIYSTLYQNIPKNHILRSIKLQSSKSRQVFSNLKKRCNYNAFGN